MKQLEKLYLKTLLDRINEIEAHREKPTQQLLARQYNELISLYEGQGYNIKGFEKLYDWDGRIII